MRRILLCIACCCIITFQYSCGKKNRTPNGEIISSDIMQEILWDVFQADAFTERFIKIDTSKNAVIQNVNLQRKIFELHKVTKEDFYLSYDYYNSHPALMRILLDSITAKAERKRGQMMKEQYSGRKFAQ